ncbi:hypothetical protein LJC59_04815 [Desulfovibrio sp. OttesenSCG-928-A18]|nr:hypothetical protein [Desulfovibrio sp. OttesenSCG-928-A18]
MRQPVFYIPLLHRSLAPQSVPPSVAFFPCGLSNKNSAAPGGAAAQESRPVPQDVLYAEQSVRAALPLDAGQARAVLEELLRMGEELTPDGLLRQLSAGSAPDDGNMPLASWRSRTGESAALATFAESGTYPELARPNGPNGAGGPGGMEGMEGTGGAGAVPDWNAEALLAEQRARDTRQALVDCQKVLLLAWSLEERRAEAMLLEEQYRRAQSALRQALGDGGQDTDAPVGFSIPDNAVSWRLFLDAALPFLPAGAVLYTQDERMADELRNAGMLQPFPEDRARCCSGWPGELVHGLLLACLPAWRLVGRKRPAPERPWLDRDVELLVARPNGGWLQ